MTCNCGNGTCSGCKGCGISGIVKVLLIIGGLNWGIIGVGMLMGIPNLNVVKMLLGSMPTIEAIIYIIVGVAALMKIFGCPCKKCKGDAVSTTSGM